MRFVRVDLPADESQYLELLVDASADFESNESEVFVTIKPPLSSGNIVTTLNEFGFSGSCHFVSGAEVLDCSSIYQFIAASKGVTNIELVDMVAGTAESISTPECLLNFFANLESLSTESRYSQLKDFVDFIYWPDLVESSKLANALSLFGNQLVGFLEFLDCFFSDGSSFDTKTLLSEDLTLAKPDIAALVLAAALPLKTTLKTTNDHLYKRLTEILSTYETGMAMSCTRVDLLTNSASAAPLFGWLAAFSHYWAGVQQAQGRSTCAFLAYFRALECISNGVLIELGIAEFARYGKRGSQIRLGIDHEAVLGFGKVWARMKIYLSQHSNITENSLQRIDSLIEFRNRVLLTHGSLVPNPRLVESIRNSFQSLVGGFNTEPNAVKHWQRASTDFAKTHQLVNFSELLTSGVMNLCLVKPLVWDAS